MTHEDILALQGKRIESIEIIESECLRSYVQYLCIVCQDGTKLLLYGDTPAMADPDAEEMRKAPNFYTPEEIAEKVRREEYRKRNYQLDKEEKERREYDRLKAKFEDKS
jgi:hypothetical protein